MGIPFDLTVESLPEIPDFCPVLNIPLLVRDIGGDDYSPSLDRIIPELGYTQDNVIWVSLRSNRVKCNAHWSELIRIGNFYSKLRHSEPPERPKTHEQVKEWRSRHENLLSTDSPRYKQRIALRKERLLLKQKEIEILKQQSSKVDERKAAQAQKEQQKLQLVQEVSDLLTRFSQDIKNSCIRKYYTHQLRKEFFIRYNWNPPYLEPYQFGFAVAKALPNFKNIKTTKSGIKVRLLFLTESFFSD